MSSFDIDPADVSLDFSTDGEISTQTVEAELAELSIPPSQTASIGIDGELMDFPFSPNIFPLAVGGYLFDVHLKYETESKEITIHRVTLTESENDAFSFEFGKTYEPIDSVSFDVTDYSQQQLDIILLYGIGKLRARA